MSGMQKAFSAVVAHLRAQGRKAMGGLGQSTYCYQSNINGDKCAIGGLIPDEMINYNLSGLVGSLIHYHPEIQAHFEKEYGEMPMRFYSDLQNIHDAYKVEEWEEEFVRFAARWDLEVPAKS